MQADSKSSFQNGDFSGAGSGADDDVTVPSFPSMLAPSSENKVVHDALIAHAGKASGTEASK